MTASAILTLALGFGVNAAIFSLTRSVLLRPLPYADVDRLVLVGEASPSRGVSYLPAVPASYVEWRERVTAFESTAAWRFVYFTLSGETDRPMRIQGVLVTPTFFPLLGVTPALGRQFMADDSHPGHNQVVLLSNGFWHRQFGADPNVVGRALTVDGTRCTIVGVLPESFKFFRVLNRELELWRPFVLNRSDREHSINLYAKLKRGVTLESARAELATAYAALPAEGFRDGWIPEVARLTTRFTANQRPILQALQVAALLVLCIAAANVANLVLAVASGRRKDVAIRLALGATRWQLLTEVGRETLLLAGAGAVAGALLATWIVDLLNSSLSYSDINRLEPFRVDGWVVAFTACLAIAIAMIFSVLPSRRAADSDVVDALKDSSQGVTPAIGRRRTRAALVIGELALSIVLLTSAFQLTQSALSLNGMDRGVDAERVMSAQLSLNAPQYGDTIRLTQFADAVVDRLTSAAGIKSASVVNYPPLSIIGTSTPIAVDGQPTEAGKEPAAQYWVVGRRYFATVGIRMLAGRDFNRGDAANDLGVAIVSRRFAERFWNRTDVIGERITPLLPASDAFWIPRTTRRPLTIVGVVDDVREDGIPGHPDDRQPQFYLPFSQSPTRIMTIVARTAGPPQAAAPLVRDAVQAVDPDQPTFDEKSLDDVRSETFARSRELAWLIGSFAALALILSAVGVYGVVGDAMKLALAGIAVGAVAAPVAMRVAGAWVVGLNGSNPLAIAAVAALLSAVCVGAAALPARAAANAAAVAFR